MAISILAERYSKSMISLVWAIPVVPLSADQMEKNLFLQKATGMSLKCSNINKFFAREVTQPDQTKKQV